LPHFSPIDFLMKYLVSLICLFPCCALLAQTDSNDSYRPKIAEFSVEALMDYHTTSSSEDLGSLQNEVDNDRLYKAKIAVPVVMNKQRLIATQLKYYQYKFFFDEDEFTEDQALYSHLSEAKFTSVGLRALYREKIGLTDQLMLAGGAEINADQLQWRQNTTKYFFSGIYSRQISNRTKIGGGFVFNQAMRITSLYPVFNYERQLSPKYHLSLSLPKSIAVRRKINNTNYLIGTAQVRGWRYNLSNAIEGETSDLTLRRGDLELSVSWEREIHDWLWFGVTLGYNKNLRYYLAEPGKRQKDAIINIQSEDARYAKLSLFIVPPRKFYQ